VAADPVSQPDYFAFLGVPRRFGQDLSVLEKRFYELSREFHPDRFTTSGADAQRLSLEKMSFLNQAYRTLKDPVERREYLLKLEGVEGKSRAPIELAEAWFEVQDAPEKWDEFERYLAGVRAETETAIRAQEQVIDQGSASREAWVELAGAGDRLNYIKSLNRDLERVRSRFHGKR
jgi:Fe-S protein assembly co-chaperone HscB